MRWREKFLVLGGECYRWYLTRARHPQKQRLISHYWKWFSKPTVWIKYDEGLAVRASLVDYIQRTIFFTNYYEPDLVAWLKRELREDDVFWDVGANIGVMTMIAATRCREVVSFEPEPRALQRLRGHVAANELTRVRIVEVALSDAAGQIEMGQAPTANLGMNSILLVGDDWKRFTVKTARADDLVASGALPQPSVMKVDVEGAEELVFRGADQVLRNPRLRAIVFEALEGKDHLPKNTALIEWLTQRGFEVEPFGYSDPEIKDSMNNYIAKRKL